MGEPGEHSGTSVAAGADGPSVDDAGQDEPRRRRHILRSSFFVFLCVLVVCVVVASFVTIPYDALTPGSGVDVASLVTVPRHVRHTHRGEVFLTDVDIVPLRAIDYLFYALNGADQIDPASELTGSQTSSEYDEEGVIDMGNARQAATVVALSTLGYHVEATPSGVIVYAAFPGSPAAKDLGVGAVITAVDATATPTIAALQQRLTPLKPGDVVRLTVHRYGSRATHKVRLALGAFRVSGKGAARTLVCVSTRAARSLGPPPAGIPNACLGVSAPTVQSEQAYRLSKLPFPVSLNSDGIIGPSAGLSFTLGLLDVLSRGDLTGGKKVAATGTMSVSGSVGQVGGVAQKTVAVRQAGASVFIVPKAQYNVAEAHAGPTLKVLGVTSLTEALADLERLGGRLGPGVRATRS